MGMETMLAISIGSALLSTYGQYEQAKAQAAANERQRQATMQAFRENYNQTNVMQQQETEQASQKIFNNNQQASAAMATTRVNAGENGISGLSVNALLADLAGKRDRYNDSVQTNLDYASMAIQNQRQNVANNAQSQINSLQTPQTPDYLGAGLRIGAEYMDYKNPTKNSKYYKG